MRYIKHAAIGAALALSACGNNSSDNSVSSQNTITLPDARFTFAELNNRIGSSVLTQDNPITTQGNLPTTGTADYAGYIGLGGYFPGGLVSVPVDVTRDRDYMLGEVTIRADFSNSTLNGVAGNFRQRDGRELGGAITLTDGIIRGGESTENSAYQSNFDGTLTQADGSNIIIDATILGRFETGEPSAITRGNIVGTIDRNDRTEQLRGTFVAQEQ